MTAQRLRSSLNAMRRCQLRRSRHKGGVPSFDNSDDFPKDRCRTQFDVTLFGEQCRNTHGILLFVWPTKVRSRHRSPRGNLLQRPPINESLRFRVLQRSIFKRTSRFHAPSPLTHKSVPQQKISPKRVWMNSHHLNSNCFRIRIAVKIAEYLRQIVESESTARRRLSQTS